MKKYKHIHSKKPINNFQDFIKFVWNFMYVRFLCFLFICFLLFIAIDTYQIHNTLNSFEKETLKLFSSYDQTQIRTKEVNTQKKIIQQFINTKDSWTLRNSVPPNCMKNSRPLGNRCYCEEGFFRSLDRTFCVKIPQNAHKVVTNTDVWICNSGYQEMGDSCVNKINSNGNTNYYYSNNWEYSYDGWEDEDSYNDGYEWAEDNDIDDFNDCQYEFDTSDAEDGCNEYIKENYSDYQSFHGYECTEDCSGHEAGYAWAEDNDISDSWDCDGYSDSFIEGCWAYAEENY